MSVIFYKTKSQANNLTKTIDIDEKLDKMGASLNNKGDINELSIKS